MNPAETRSAPPLHKISDRTELLDRPHLIDVEGVELTAAVAIDGLCNAGEQASQLGVVVLRDHRARRSSLRPVRHGHETTQGVDARAPCWIGLLAANWMS